MKTYDHNLFPCIVSEIECDFYNYIKEDLISWIYNYQSKTEGVYYSNMGGWQSPHKFHLEPSFEEFKSYILSNALKSLSDYSCKFILSSMWININKNGDYNTYHDHAGSLLSGVFWVKTPDNCGNLIFRSPHSFSEHILYENMNPEKAKRLNYYHSYHFLPKEGQMLLFPSHLLHTVYSNNSTEDRISIAFNLRI